MTIEEAFSQLIQSPEFKDVAKEKDALGSKYRVYLRRHKLGELKVGAMVELLLANGYEVKANKVTRSINSDKPKEKAVKKKK